MAGTFHTLSYGVGGHRSLETLNWLRGRIDELRPDIVITLFGINDMAWNGGVGAGQ